MEHDEAVAARLGDRRAVEEDLTLGRLLEAGEQADQRALAAARRPHHDRELGALDGEGTVVHHLLAEMDRAVGLADVLDPDLARDNLGLIALSAMA